VDNATEYMYPPTETIESIRDDRDHIWHTLQEVTRERDRLKRELEAERRRPTPDDRDRY
jgi:hypothetical protein